MPAWAAAAALSALCSFGAGALRLAGLSRVPYSTRPWVPERFRGPVAPSAGVFEAPLSRVDFTGETVIQAAPRRGKISWGGRAGGGKSERALPFRAPPAGST
jgi:hypothetical protein